jgi:hypothetical protein
MNKVKILITISAFSLLVLMLPAVASAQWYPQGNQYPNQYPSQYPSQYPNQYPSQYPSQYPNDPYGRNGGYSTDSRQIVRSLKSRTREFTRQVDRDLDNSRVDGTRREDQINDIAKRFRDAVNDLDNNGRLNSNEVNRVHQYAQQMDSAIGRARLSYQTQNLWGAIRNDLQYLGGYGYYDNNRNNRNNRNQYPQRYPYPQTRNRNLPSWWPF